MFLFAAEAVLKAEVLCKTEVMSRAELASGLEYSPPLRYETAVKPTILSMPDMLPSGEVTKNQAPPAFEEPLMELSRSEVSFESNESSTLEDSSMSEAFPGPEELSNVEISAPGVLGENRYFSAEYLGPEAAASLLEAEHYAREDEPSLEPLRILATLQDPFAEVEAKLARLSSTVAMTDSSQTVVPQVPEQAPEQVANDLWSGRGGLGTQGPLHIQSHWPLLLSGVYLCPPCAVWGPYCPVVWRGDTLSDTHWESWDGDPRLC